GTAWWTRARPSRRTPSVPRTRATRGARLISGWTRSTRGRSGSTGDGPSARPARYCREQPEPLTRPEDGGPHGQDHRYVRLQPLRPAHERGRRDVAQARRGPPGDASCRAGQGDARARPAAGSRPTPAPRADAPDG